MSLSLGFFSLRRPASRGTSASGSVSPPGFELLLELLEEPAALLSFAAAAAAPLDTSSGNGFSLAASLGCCAGGCPASGAEASEGWLCCCCAASFETSSGNGFSCAADLGAGVCFCCLLGAGGEDWLPESGAAGCWAVAGSISNPPNASSTAQRAREHIVTSRNGRVSCISLSL